MKARLNANLHRELKYAKLSIEDDWLCADGQHICKIEGETLVFVHKSRDGAFRYGQREIVVTLAGLTNLMKSAQASRLALDN